ncbi:MAG: CC/Se motif family (seleno)protein [Sedimentibacter sp.]
MAIDSNKIKITEKALNYLNKKSKTAITIGYPDYRTNGDFAVVPVPEILAKKPKLENGYNKINIDGIDVYVSKLVYLPEENDIIVDVDTFLRMQFLTMSGFSIKGQ